MDFEGTLILLHKFISPTFDLPILNFFSIASPDRIRLFATRISTDCEIQIIQSDEMRKNFKSAANIQR